MTIEISIFLFFFRARRWYCVLIAIRSAAARLIPRESVGGRTMEKALRSREGGALRWTVREPTGRRTNENAANSSVK